MTTFAESLGIESDLPYGRHRPVSASDSADCSCGLKSQRFVRLDDLACHHLDVLALEHRL
ncbi:MAG: hypothetical protein QOD67_4241 [Caballeronia sp.]|jgi:hypothetical protein|nr:hypothetical protein [Caballeronia sp.]